MIALPECPSTNTWALEHLDALAHGACVWTPQQTAGRGRDGATWRSPPGVLTASFVCDTGSEMDAVRLALAAGLAVAHAVEDLLPTTTVMIKWPNDCLVRGRKLAGILCESVAGRTVVGIGLNRAPAWGADPASLPLAAGKTPPIGLDELAPTAPTEAAVLRALRRYLLEACGLIAADGWPRLLPALRERDHLMGRRLVLTRGNDTVSGQADGIDDTGGLRLRVDRGDVHICVSGHIIRID